MNQPFYLYQLQKIDSQIDHDIARRAEIARLLEEDQTIRIAEAQYAAAQTQLNIARAELEKIEASVSTAKIKLEQNQAALYGGRIHNPKELQDLQNESAALKRQISSLEDQQLERMLDLENAENEEMRCQKESTEAQASFTSRQASLIGEGSILEKHIEKLKIERTVAAGSIEPENLEIYQRLRSQKKGIAVAVLADGESCSACGASLAPSERQAARSPTKFFFCSSCGRILYAG